MAPVWSFLCFSGMLNQRKHYVCHMKSYMYGHHRWQGYYVQLLNVTQTLLNNVADGITHCAKVVYFVPPCDKDVKNIRRTNK